MASAIDPLLLAQHQQTNPRFQEQFRQQQQESQSEQPSQASPPKPPATPQVASVPRPPFRPSLGPGVRNLARGGKFRHLGKKK